MRSESQTFVQYLQIENNLLNGVLQIKVPAIRRFSVFVGHRYICLHEFCYPAYVIPEEINLKDDVLGSYDN